MILAGGKYLEIKASLHLFHESILFLGKDENQALARSLSEKGNSFNLTISLSTSFLFCISHKSTKLFRWVEASSLGRPEIKRIFHDKTQQGNINFTRFSISKRSNRSANKIIVVGIGKITQLGVFLRHRDKAGNLAHKQIKRKRKDERKEGE